MLILHQQLNRQVIQRKGNDLPRLPKYPPTQEGAKVCPRCKEEKLLTTEFWHKSKSRKDGFNGHCRICQTANRRVHFSLDSNRIKKNENENTRHKVQRLVVLKHYAGDPPKCACEGCDVTDVEWLTIDHIDGGGRQHKLTFKGPLDRWLLRNNFPEGFRVLCMNCNHALGQYGYCPHQRKGVSTNGNV